MALSLARPILRQSILRQSQSLGKPRFVHIENKLGDNMPFSYSNKRAFGIKLAAFLLSGFSIPFIAASVQLKRAGGSA
ncbi:hypothetical protein SISNIDRAFT_481480 [Sistotremastrum niveocremeum HHB9708]|uniref:Cytochrome c oxidase subunit 8, mitochondrial n=2 Tax=Sistotremastraceae TaxID=3402574 RepID=A0A164Z5A0_9AGAM|nr:hypothetical protein SISNIDRAFT_481480 [Sistotremastrum niveocremeum HHB9708]KZT37663.1 hypothetical protein SISSUDRAFT_1062677 [Sistotremastrum suecicum HHB10207 ss-3]